MVFFSDTLWRFPVRCSAVLSPEGYAAVYRGCTACAVALCGAYRVALWSMASLPRSITVSYGPLLQTGVASV